VILTPLLEKVYLAGLAPWSLSLTELLYLSNRYVPFVGHAGIVIVYGPSIVSFFHKFSCFAAMFVRLRVVSYGGYGYATVRS
jgi:hypothetical protein